MREAIITFPGLGLTLNPPAGFDFMGRTIYFYGICAALGFLLGLLYALRSAKRFGLTEDHIYDTIIFALPMGIIGARLYYVIFNFDLYRGRPIADMFAIWEGGLAIYGGVIAGAVTLATVCLVKKYPAPAILDMGGYGLLLGQGIARWGNFFNREAYGAETDAFTRMGLTLNGSTTYVHPTFFYEFSWNMIGFALLHLYAKSGKRKFDGEIFALYVIWYGIGRFFIEGLRADSLYIGHTGIRVSQVVALVSAAAAAALVLWQRRKPHTLYVDRVSSTEENSETSLEG